MNVMQGTEGFEKQMDRLMELSEYMVKKIKSMPDKYYLILEPEMVNVSFWYIPKRLRSMPHTQEKVEILGQVSVKVKPYLGKGILDFRFMYLQWVLLTISVAFLLLVIFV